MDSQYPLGSLTGLNAAMNGQNVQWQQPQPATADPNAFLQMLLQPQPRPQAPAIDLQKLLAPVPTHDSTANISNGGSLFSNPNFYNQDGSRVNNAPQYTPQQMANAQANTNAYLQNSGMVPHGYNIGQTMLPPTGYQLPPQSAAPVPWPKMQ